MERWGRQYWRVLVCIGAGVLSSFIIRQTICSDQRSSFVLCKLADTRGYVLRGSGTQDNFKTRARASSMSSPISTNVADAIGSKVSAHLGHTIDVLECGAVGDGASDDTAALRAALAAALATARSAQSAGGLWDYTIPTLRLPAGVYRITGPISSGVPMNFVRVRGENAIIKMDAGTYAFDVGAYVQIEGLQFLDGAHALKVATNNTESIIVVDGCKFVWQTMSAIDIDAASGGGTVMSVTRCRFTPPIGGSTKVLTAASGDSVLFRDCWIYGAHATEGVFRAGCALKMECCHFNPYNVVAAWFDQYTHLDIDRCVFGGENTVGCLVRCYTASGPFPTGPETHLNIQDSSIYMPGVSPLVKFYAIPNAVRIVGNTGLISTEPFWFDAKIPATDVQNVGGYDSVWDVRQNCWPLYEQILVGPDAARKGIPFAADPRRRHELGELNAADYLRNIGPLDGAYGIANVTDCGSTAALADDEDPTIKGQRYAATTDGQYFALGHKALLAGLAAQIMTAAVTVTVETDSTVELQLTAHHAVMIRLVGPGRHILCLPFYYNGAAPDTVEIAAYNMQVGSSVLVERFQVLQGEHSVRSKRAELVGTAAPTTGTWLRGDKLRVLSPAAGSVREYVCTAGGSPGIWTATGLIGNAKAVKHDYGAGTTAWNMTSDEAAGTFFTVTNASSAADAIFPVATPGKQFTVYNNSGQAITFKVSGQAGVASTSGKYSLWVMNAMDCVKIYEQP